MNTCEEISQSLKKKNILILEKSVDENHTKESDPQKDMLRLDTSMLKIKDQSSRKKILISNELSFGLGNSYFELCLKPDDSNTNSHLEITGKSEKLYKGNYSSCKEGERKQVLPFSLIKNRSDFSASSLPNGEENVTNSYKENAKIGSYSSPREAIQLMKSTDENKAPKKRRHEDGVFNSSVLEECDAVRKKILLKTDKESYMGNPYLEFILKSEDSNPDIDFKENDANNLASGREDKMGEKDKRCINNGGDIFGNNFTSKDRNKFKVICPHCNRKVPAPGFVRHLTYCMKVGIRKRTRRS